MSRRPTYASLEALSSSASSARLLNLACVAARHGGDREYRERPFFQTAMLNTCLVLKHTPRAHERAIFDRPPSISTKVIIPFDRDNLALGGRTVFVGQKGWTEQLEMLTNGARTIARDCKVLLALDELPSLDPFLVREHLSRRGFKVAPCYLTISDPDILRMKRTVAAEVGQLIGLAFAGGDNKEATARLAQVLLTNEADSRLEPLRLTLKLEGEAYKEGIFAWRGFLYYKWAVDSLRTGLLRVIREIGDMTPENRSDMATAAEVTRGKGRLLAKIEASERSAVKALSIYDNAFWSLVRHNQPSAFRDFLLESPRMFMSLGEAVGGLSHITSYWTYRFPKGAPLLANAEEMLEILQEFEGSLPPVFTARSQAA